MNFASSMVCPLGLPISRSFPSCRVAWRAAVDSSGSPGRKTSVRSRRDALGVACSLAGGRPSGGSKSVCCFPRGPRAIAFIDHGGVDEKWAGVHPTRGISVARSRRSIGGWGRPFIIDRSDDQYFSCSEIDLSAPVATSSRRANRYGSKSAVWRRESDYDAADGLFLARGSTPRFTMTKLDFPEASFVVARIGRRGTMLRPQRGEGGTSA